MPKSSGRALGKEFFVARDKIGTKMFMGGVRTKCIFYLDGWMDGWMDGFVVVVVVVVVVWMNSVPKTLNLGETPLHFSSSSSRLLVCGQSYCRHD